jgi:Flp pilus assembly protein TadG
MVLPGSCLLRNREEGRGSVTGCPVTGGSATDGFVTGACAAEGVVVGGSVTEGGSVAGRGRSRWRAASACRGRSRWRAASACRGSSAVELAILAPLLLLIIFLSVQFAFWYQGRQVALAAAQAGARLARQEADVNAAWRTDAQNAAAAYYNQLGTKVFSGGITARATGSAVNQVGVRVTGRVVSIVFGLKLTIHETVTGPVECFRPDVNGGQRCG